MINQHFKTKPLKAMAAVLSAALLFATAWGGMGKMPVQAEEAGQPARGQLNVAYHTQEEISARIKSDGVTLNDPLTFAVEPQFTPPYENAGTLSQETLDSSIKMLNQIRYIAGLQDNVTLNEEYNLKAQAAAMVNCVNRALSHYPSQPAGMAEGMYQLGYQGASSSNLAMASWNRSFNASIVQAWMNDGDASNIDRVGHRRWVLFPQMGQTGFGAVYNSGSGTYSAMYCFDRSNRSASETQVAWPAQNMPVEYFKATYPWSISMGTAVDMGSVHVTLRRTNDNTVWNFSAGGSDGYFNVNNDGYGQTGCIIFRPDGITGYYAGDTFEVTISGSGINLSYTVNFFDPDHVARKETATAVDWTAVNALIDTVPEGGIAPVLTGCSFEVPAETLNKLAGRNVMCAFYTDSDMIFSVSGQNLRAASAPWNVDISYQTLVPGELLDLARIISDDMRTFSIADTGAFPAPMNVFISWGTENAGKLAILYYYEPAYDALVGMDAFVVAESGQSVFTLDGSRQYVAIVTQ